MNVRAKCAAFAAAILFTGPVDADTLRFGGTFNSGSYQMAEQQPADGVTVNYPVAFTGALDGCTGQATETLYPRDEESWGIYEVADKVTCEDGGFAFTARGSWDSKGFHGAGEVTEGSGSGSYAGLAGPLAQSGVFTPAQNDTEDFSYEIMIDRAAP